MHLRYPAWRRFDHSFIKKFEILYGFQLSVFINSGFFRLDIGQARHIIPEIKFILLKYYSGYKIVHFTKLKTRIEIPLCCLLQTSSWLKFSFCVVEWKTWKHFACEYKSIVIYGTLYYQLLSSYLAP